MVKTASTMLPLGTNAPDFRLPNIDGSMVSLSGVETGKGLVVMFLCNHCPFVKHVAPELVRLANDYTARGIHFVAISSNDIAQYPDDAPERMKQEAAEQGYAFPYLYDESQEVAQAYRAACTPDFFVFDANRRLVYRGQIDDSRPGNGKPLNGADMRRALDQVLSGQDVPAEQRPSIGCNIKWKRGKEPGYFNPAGIQ
ncbi:MAG: thioredoxin family protein [Planctomycetota bacterium]|jgi:peroxiredoxin